MTVQLSRLMLKMVVFVMMAVLIAMMIDLCSGLYKAKQRGELRTSEALRRTLSKFISYEGGLTIAAMVDFLISMAGFFDLFGIARLSEVPVVTILVGIFLLVVEYLSVREKADEKTKKQRNETAELLYELIKKKEFKEALEHIKSNQNKETV